MIKYFPEPNRVKRSKCKLGPTGVNKINKTLIIPERPGPQEHLICARRNQNKLTTKQRSGVEGWSHTSRDMTSGIYIMPCVPIHKGISRPDKHKCYFAHREVVRRVVSVDRAHYTCYLRADTPPSVTPLHTPRLDKHDLGNIYNICIIFMRDPSNYKYAKCGLMFHGVGPYLETCDEALPWVGMLSFV